ncbi:hypothetical protein SH661x_004199 [Planctomicrobium sp. SH661]|uniref:hypothetical protein n=1 Tax=Planctomicrobium sp. SH661 TaxID=3448124 RepID=UPI003F5B595D
MPASTLSLNGYETSFYRETDVSRSPDMFRILRHAFAVNTPLPPPTREQLQVVERIAHEVVRRRLTTPALTFLEMSRPLNFLGSQAMHFFSPMVTTVLDAPAYEVFAKFLERRDAIDLIVSRIEHLERLATQRESSNS